MPYHASEYGDLWAEIYDDEHANMDPSAAVTFLAELVHGGQVLELGIGTGRIALPLFESGVRVRGIDASAAMVDRMRDKPRGAEIEVALGDMATSELAGPYSLVFVAFNTLFGLTDQEAQIACFRNVANALRPHGRFVVECFVPDLVRFRDGHQTVRVVPGGSSDRFRMNASLHFADQQRVETDVMVVREGTIRVLPVMVRYIWPSELDLMGRLAGFELEGRFADWRRQPFTASSTSHVSVYRKIA